MGILTKIRQRPDNQKRIFSLVGAGVLTVIILVIWLSLTNTSSEPAVIDQEKLSSISPIQLIKEEFSKAVSGFKTGSTSSSTVSVEVINE